MGLGAKFGGAAPAKRADEPLPNLITSAEQLVGIMKHSGLNFGVSGG